MIEITPLMEINADDVKRIATGYVSDDKYVVSRTESEDCTVIRLKLISLENPYVKRFNHTEDTLHQYMALPQHGFSLGAYDAAHNLVGIALAEPHTWNRSLWVPEFHVAESHHRMGIGRKMMEILAQKGKAADLRTIVCETQNTNVPAIRFYRSVGFTVNGVDLSYYTNDDWPDGEVAIFMKRRLT